MLLLSERNRVRNTSYSDITFAYPKELSWIIKSKKKNDHVDSNKLARLHLVDMIPESHMLNEDERISRDLLIQRVKLGRSITTTKNGIIGYLKREGLFDSLPKTNDNLSKKRRIAMNAIKLGNQKDLVLLYRRYKEVPEFRQVSFVLWHCTCKPGFLINCA